MMNLWGNNQHKSFIYYIIFISIKYYDDVLYRDKNSFVVA